MSAHAAMNASDAASATRAAVAASFFPSRAAGRAVTRLEPIRDPGREEPGRVRLPPRRGKLLAGNRVGHEASPVEIGRALEDRHPLRRELDLRAEPGRDDGAGRRGGVVEVEDLPAETRHEVGADAV